MERTMRVATFVAIFVAIMAAQPAAGSTLARASACSDTAAVAASASAELASMRCLVNGVRASHGLPELRELSQLDRSSGLRAGAIRRCGQFSHTPCGQGFAQPFVRVGYLKRNGAVGENLAWGGSSLGSPGATLAAWLRAPEHRADLLPTGWRGFGIGLARGNLVGYTRGSSWVLQ